MANRWIIIDQLKLNYEGLFNFSEFYRMIDEWFFHKGYDKEDRMTEEIETPTGKVINLELRPWKKTTDYVKNVIKIKIHVKDLKDVEVEKDDALIKLNHGKMLIIIDGLVKTDYQKKWAKAGWFFFINILFDVYIYKRYFAMTKANLIADVNDIHARMKTYFNSFKYTGEFKPQWGTS